MSSISSIPDRSSSSTTGSRSGLSSVSSCSVSTFDPTSIPRVLYISDTLNSRVPYLANSSVSLNSTLGSNSPPPPVSGSNCISSPISGSFSLSNSNSPESVFASSWRSSKLRRSRSSGFFSSISCDFISISSISSMPDKSSEGSAVEETASGPGLAPGGAPTESGAAGAGWARKTSLQLEHRTFVPAGLMSVSSRLNLALHLLQVIIITLPYSLVLR